MNRASAIVAGLLMLTAGWCQAATPAGEVQSLSGRATAATPNGEIRALERGGSVYSGETIVTGPATYARLHFTDDSYIMLRPRSRFLIQDYEHTGKPAEERGFFALLKGGLRAVTGLIGKLARNNYRVQTDVATIGIRGTDFQLVVCHGDCQSMSIPPPPDGLYAGVNHGAIVSDNATGETEWKAGQFFFVNAQGAAPLAIKPPVWFQIPPADPAMCP